ncbi:hypothetical protein ACTFIY_000079 [Dictyostelium cf. discoideum]
MTPLPSFLSEDSFINYKWEMYKYFITNINVNFLSSYVNYKMPSHHYKGYMNEYYDDFYEEKDQVDIETQPYDSFDQSCYDCVENNIEDSEDLCELADDEES